MTVIGLPPLPPSSYLLTVKHLAGLSCKKLISAVFEVSFFSFSFYFKGFFSVKTDGWFISSGTAETQSLRVYHLSTDEI